MSAPALRFLADEGCDFAVVRALRDAGFDAAAVCEIMPRSIDSDILKLSHAENRVLLTEDKDFGWLVFVSHADSAGVVLIRFPGRKELPLKPEQNEHINLWSKVNYYKRESKKQKNS
jgi:hypothetical protein